jgi:hypothetical protein
VTLLVQALDFIAFLPSGSENEIPIIRLHGTGEEAPARETFLHGCRRVHLSFEIDDGDEPGMHEEERIVITCYAQVEGAQHLQNWISFGATFPKVLADQTRERMHKVGYWWLMARFNNDEQYASLTVDPFGSIISRHIVKSCDDHTLSISTVRMHPYQ